jgi:hypothetical protein
MATTPNVVLRTHYYDLKSEGREFYSSNMDDDYLSYIDKGIKTTKVRDYVAYAGDDEKSSGIFSANGLLSKEEKKELREELRETKSTIWDYVISFEEKYGKENCYSWQKAKDLLAKTLPSYFRSVGLDPEKTVWYAGLHENTDNRHIHLSFFQKEPTAYDRKTKTRVYRRGKIPIAKINGLKIAIERHYLEPVEGVARVRKLMVEETKKSVTGSYTRDSESFKFLVRKLSEEIPLTGDLGYESANMDGCRSDIDAATDLVMENECIAPKWKEVLDEADERDRKMTLICCRQKIDPTPYLYRPDVRERHQAEDGERPHQRDRRQARRSSRKAMGLHHPKARQRLRMLTALDMVLGAVAMSERVSQEAWDAFDEYEAKMRQFEREKEKEEEME